jgi:two-component sensor histidine kinase
VTQQNAGKDRSAALWPTVAWLAVVATLVGIGRYAQSSDPFRTMRGPGRMLPRLPGPAPDVPTLLFQLGVGSVVWYAVVVAFPLMLVGARRIDAERDGKLKSAAMAAGAVVVLIAISSIIQYFVTYGGASNRPGFAAYIPQALRVNVLPWMAVTGIVAIIEARRRAVHAALDHERLRAQIAEQRLIALTGQLHPHFLFNTLQGISTLIHRDPEAADEMLAKLSDLLRDLLRHRDHALVPLSDELRYARTYLEIAQLRFADRLRFEVAAPPELDQASVPLFILQPLVENALAHGIGGRSRGGTVCVKATRHGDRLRLEVADDGAGLTNGGVRREGIGLSNTRERLRASFGDDHRFSLGPADSGGVVVSIDIPFRLNETPTTA